MSGYKIYVLNAFSLQMLDREVQAQERSSYMKTIRIPRPCNNPVEWLNNWIEMGKARVVSAIGHESTAAIFSTALGQNLAANRINVKIEDGIIALIGQYIGPRLPEGATELPEGAKIEWWVV